MGISMIAAVGRNLEIGVNGKLIWHIPEDMKFFRETTMGHPVLMGRKTFESLPAMLPGRENIVLTRDVSFAKARSSRPSLRGSAAIPRPVACGPSVKERFRVITDLSQLGSDEEVFVIGGGEIYRLMLDKADTLYLTEIDADCPEADTFFPTFSKSDFDLEVLGSGEHDGIKFRFCKYTRK